MTSLRRHNVSAPSKLWTYSKYTQRIDKIDYRLKKKKKKNRGKCDFQDFFGKITMEMLISICIPRYNNFVIWKYLWRHTGSQRLTTSLHWWRDQLEIIWNIIFSVSAVEVSKFYLLNYSNIHRISYRIMEFTNLLLPIPLTTPYPYGTPKFRCI